MDLDLFSVQVWVRGLVGRRAPGAVVRGEGEDNNRINLIHAEKISKVLPPTHRPILLSSEFDLLRLPGGSWRGSSGGVGAN